VLRRWYSENTPGQYPTNPGNVKEKSCDGEEAESP
jgi:hypothetical protein